MITTLERIRREVCHDGLLAHAPSTLSSPLPTPPELLLGEPQALPRLIDAIRGAKSVVDISLYSWMATGSGAELAKVVEQKAREGVEVNVMVDGYGSMQIPGTSAYQQVQEMRAAGVHVIVNDSINPLSGQPIDHTKVYVIDGKGGFLGGMNLAATYDKWHDAMFTLDQASAVTAGRDFLARWALRGGTVSAANQAAMHPANEPATNPETRVLTNHPGGTEQVTAAYLSTISTATKRVWVESPFVGSQAMIDALCAAARRGVDVRLVTDGSSTNDAVPGIPLVGRSYYTELAAAGVKIYEQAQMTHSKVLLTDDTVTAGSFNLTRRSEALHYEIDLQSSSTSFVNSVRAMFDSDLATAHQVTEAELHGATNVVLSWLHRLLHIQY